MYNGNGKCIKEDEKGQEEDNFFLNNIKRGVCIIQ